MKKCPVCGEPDCLWWESRFDEHDLDEEEEEEESELERERRTRG